MSPTLFHTGLSPFVLTQMTGYSFKDRFTTETRPRVVRNICLYQRKDGFRGDLYRMSRSGTVDQVGI